MVAVRCNASVAENIFFFPPSRTPTSIGFESVKAWLFLPTCQQSMELIYVWSLGTGSKDTSRPRVLHALHGYIQSKRHKFLGNTTHLDTVNYTGPYTIPARR